MTEQKLALPTVPRPPSPSSSPQPPRRWPCGLRASGVPVTGQAGRRLHMTGRPAGRQRSPEQPGAARSLPAGDLLTATCPETRAAGKVRAAPHGDEKTRTAPVLEPEPLVSVAPSMTLPTV